MDFRKILQTKKLSGLMLGKVEFEKRWLRYRLLSFIVVCISSLSHTVSAEFLTIEVDASSTKVFGGRHSYIIEDETGSLTYANVSSLAETAWLLNSDEKPSFGISDSHFWLRTQVKNVDELTQDYVAHIDYTALDYVDFYVEDGQSRDLLKSYQTGDRRAFETRPIEHLSFAFPFMLAPKQEVIIYLKVRSRGNIAVPLAFWEYQSFFEAQKNFSMVFSAVVGMMLITGVYNLFIFLRTREKLFLSFSFFVISIAFLFINQSGFAYLYLWPNSPILNEVLVLVTISLAVCANLYFSINFLQISGRLKQTLMGMILVVALNPAIYFFGSYQIPLVLGLFEAIIGSFGALYIGFMRWFQGVRVARMYVIAWSPVTIGVLLAASIRFDLVPFSLFTENAAFFGALTTIIALSMIIADRINVEKSQRILAQLAAIESLEKYETLFRESVEGIFISTLKGKLLSANPAFLEMLGFSSVENINQTTGDNIGKLYFDASQREATSKELKKTREIVDREIQLYMHSGDSFWASCSMRLSEGKLGAEAQVKGALIDISERKKSEDKLSWMASHDPLTSIYNRREFDERLKDALKHTKENEEPFSILYLDLDQFKVVNDICGHSAGDKLLKKLTHVLVNTLGRRGIIARLGGDEFGVLVSDTKEHDAHGIAEELSHAVQNFRFIHENRVFSLRVSIGLVKLSSSFGTVENVMSLADTALYAAKDAGRNRIHVYSADNVVMEEKRREMELVSTVNLALETGRMRIARQRITSCTERVEPDAFEILVRMLDKQGSYVSPAKFIPAAERYNIMPIVDRWVINKTIRWLSSAPKLLEEAHYYSINLSAQSLNDEKFRDYLLYLFTTYSIPYKKICFEITETTAIQNIKYTVDFINFFREKGCRFSLDDFGSGFSSYSYLKSLPVDYLKIDGLFIKHVVDDEVDHAMVKSICDIAKAMGKKTIAEFVENKEAVDKLCAMGIDYLQGYFIDKPELIDTEQLNVLSKQDTRD